MMAAWKEDWGQYWRRNGRYFLMTGGTALAYQVYFLLFLSEEKTAYLWYLELLVLAVLGCFFGVDFHRYRQQKSLMRKLMERDELASRQLDAYENREVAEHDIRLLENRLNQRYLENCELQDYVARWCHEAKLPLSAALLLQEKIPEVGLRTQMREALERMRGQLSAMLFGCRLQSTLPDIRRQKVALLAPVREAIHNQQFFLIQKKFQVEVEVTDTAYTDPSWLVYILEQLISNAVKYAGDAPFLRISSDRGQDGVHLSVEDHGEGIGTEDIRHIFEKGYTGSGHHNGQYRSTGMGLYLTKRILERLEHTISVESRVGVGSRFTLTFRENPYED